MEGDVSKAQQATIEESEKVQEITLEIEKKNKDRDVRLEELMTLFYSQHVWYRCVVPNKVVELVI